MPASGGDPVSTALRLSLNASQNSTESKNLDKSLIASAARVLLTNIEYEPVGNCLSTVLNHLKSKYIPLKSQDVNKNGMEAPLSSHSSVNNSASNSNMKPEPDSILPCPKQTLFPSENVQLGWRGPHCVGAGMINAGNTCYLNSTLQALFHIPAFVNWLHSDTQHLSSCSIANGTVNGECIICAMNKTLKASENKTGSVIKPFLICNKLKFICKHLVHGQQEDAHEFMRYLLESMEKAYLSRYKGTKLDVYSKETTPLNQIFGGYIRTEVTCLQCGGVSTTFQHCQDLLLDIRRASTLDDALASYFCKERLDGEDAYRCERCHRKVSATKKFSMEKPPQVLCIQLKRFSILGGKINKHVSFTQRLDLTRFLCPQSTCQGPLPLTYRLVSMVTHVGPSVHCGHYTAVAQTSTGQYYHFDDVIVRPISLQSVLDTNAYIMMYEREPRHSQQHSSVTSTSVSPAVNGQKQNLVIRGTTAPVNSKINPAVKHKPCSLVMNNHKVESESNKPNLGSYGAVPLPPAKDRDRVVFDLHQPTATPPLSQMVICAKKGKALEASPVRQQEPSSSASLVPYCESGEDESNESSDSETAEPPGLDMPSLSDVTQNKSLMLNYKAHNKKSVENVSSAGVIPIVNSHSVVNKSESDVQFKNISSFANGTTVLPPLVNKSNGDVLNIKDDSSLQKRSGLVLVDKHKINSTGAEITCDFRSKKSSSPCSRNVNENTSSSKAGIQQASQSKSSCFTSSKSITENAIPKRQDGRAVESTGNKVIFPDRPTNNKDKQTLDLASCKEVVVSNVNGLAGNLHINTSFPTVRGKQTSGWQVTDLLLHSPSVTSESSTTSNSVANSTTDWDVSDVIPSKTSKKPHSQKSILDNMSSSFLSINSYKPSHQNADLKSGLKVHNSKSSPEKSSSERNKATVSKVELRVNGELSRYDHKASQKKNSSATNEAGVTSDELISKQRDKSSADETKFSDKKREKKLRKLKKHKKKEKISTEDNGTSSHEEDHYEWVEKTCETLGLESSHQSNTNGNCWDGSHKSSIVNHLTSLSHRGYGTPNVTSWTGEQSRMNEELQRDRMEERKRNYDNCYDDDLDRGRVKKVKHHHSVTHHKYNHFQEFHNFKQWNNNNSNNYGNNEYYKSYNNKGYYHYNNFSARHKLYNGRNNCYHQGGSYRNHYSKRNNWRYRTSF